MRPEGSKSDLVGYDPEDEGFPPAKGQVYTKLFDGKVTDYSRRECDIGNNYHTSGTVVLASLAFPIFDLERTTIEIQLLVLTTDLIANDCLPLTSFQYFSPSHLQFRSGRWVQTRLRGHCRCHNHTPR